MDDWVFVGDRETLSKDGEEVVISSTTDPSDLVIALSSSDEKEISGPESDNSSDEQEYLPDDSLMSFEMEDDVFELPPVVSPKLETINRIAHLVLPRLPAKTLLRFKLVSPNFNNLISSPFMVHSHFLHQKAVSGLFYQTETGPSYVSFDAPSSDVPDPSLSFLPEPVTVKASTHGLLCVRGHETLKYYITNPTTMEWVVLPDPTAEHSDGVAVVVVFNEPSVYNFGGDYRVVCAYPVLEGVCAFETFSTDTWAWTRSSGICTVENVVAASGTAVGGVAYWRTTMETVLSYDPMKDEWNIMLPPCAREMEEDWWELGEMDGRLSVTFKSDRGKVMVSAIAMKNMCEEPHWEKMRSFWLSESNNRFTMPIRSQGLAALIFWEVEDQNKGELVLRNMEGMVIRKFEELEYCAGFMPYISTLVPVKKPGGGRSTEVTEPSVNNNVLVQDAIQNIASNEASGSVCVLPKKQKEE